MHSEYAYCTVCCSNWLFHLCPCHPITCYIVFMSKIFDLLEAHNLRPFHKDLWIVPNKNYWYLQTQPCSRPLRGRKNTVTWELEHLNSFSIVCSIANDVLYFFTFSGEKYLSYSEFINIWWIQVQYAVCTYCLLFLIAAISVLLLPLLFS